jgi:hypothetical protein
MLSQKFEHHIGIGLIDVTPGTSYDPGHSSFHGGRAELAYHLGSLGFEFSECFHGVITVESG